MRDAGQEVSLHRGPLPPVTSLSLAEHLLGKLTTASHAAVRAELKLRVQEALNSMDAHDREGEPLRSEVKVWDRATGQPLLELDLRDFLTERLALDPQGDRLAVTGRQLTSADGKQRLEAVVRVYDVATGQIFRSFSSGDDPLLALAFSQDGTHLAAAGAGQRTVLLWDLATECPTVTHQGPEAAMDLAFSPDGRRVAVASRRMIKLLDAASGQEVLILRGFAHLLPNTNGFNPRVRFSSDGRRIAAVCHDYAKPVSIWSVEEADTDPAGRQRSAHHRALASHLEQANSSLKDAKRRAIFRFHLKWLEQAELTSAADLAARGALFAQDGRWDLGTSLCEKKSLRRQWLSELEHHDWTSSPRDGC